MQVEETLNNSNDLFLSFRREMEDMSRTKKRLEKENDVFRRHKDASSAKIFTMAEERQEMKKKLEASDKKAEKLASIIHQMQQQGRNIPPGLVQGAASDEANLDEYESDYSEGSMEVSISDETEEETPSLVQTEKNGHVEPDMSHVVATHRPTGILEAATNGHS